MLNNNTKKIYFLPSLCMLLITLSNILPVNASKVITRPPGTCLRLEQSTTTEVNKSHIDTSIFAVHSSNQGPQPTAEQINVLVQSLSLKLKHDDPNITGKDFQILKRRIAESIVEAAAGMVFANTIAPYVRPFVNNVITLKASGQVGSQLLDLNAGGELDLADKAMVAIGGMTLGGIAKGKIFKTESPRDSEIARIHGMDFAQVQGETAISVIGTIVAPVIAKQISDYVCQSLGTDSMIVYVGANLISNAACLTAKKYLEPAIKGELSSGLQAYSDGGAEAVFKKQCTRVKEAPSYFYSLGVWGLNSLVEKVSVNISRKND